MVVEKMETREDIKKVIDKSNNYDELYRNSRDVLEKMESTFKDSLKEIAKENKWGVSKRSMIGESIFDDNLNTTKPVTIFEKKGAELLKRAKNIAEKNKADKFGIMIGTAISFKTSRNNIIDELFKTRENAIQNFKNDIDDGILSNKNNIDTKKIRDIGETLGEDIFNTKEHTDKQYFEQYIKTMSLPELILGTFNIMKGMGAFEYCLEAIKKRLGNKNLFDYIDSLKKTGDQTTEVLKYSACRMLLLNKKVPDLINWINGYKGNKSELLDYIYKKTLEDRDFKIGFLTSIKDLENSQLYDGFFKNLAQKLREDPVVQKAYTKASNINNVDAFTSGKINALSIYDSAGHGGGGSFFKQDLTGYESKGFSIKQTEENPNYTKYVLKNNSNDTVTMVQMKHTGNFLPIGSTKYLENIIKGKDYNLFALRGHCYNTEKFANSLGKLNAVKENDIFVDGGCGGSRSVEGYYKSGVKGYMFSYTGTGKGDSTQSFIDKIFEYKAKGNKFGDLLGFYDNMTNDNGSDGYFAYNTERPNSIGYQYKILTTKKN